MGKKNQRKEKNRSKICNEPKLMDSMFGNIFVCESCLDALMNEVGDNPSSGKHEPLRFHLPYRGDAMRHVHGDGMSGHIILKVGVELLEEIFADEVWHSRMVRAWDIEDLFGVIYAFCEERRKVKAV